MERIDQENDGTSRGKAPAAANREEGAPDLLALLGDPDGMLPDREGKLAQIVLQDIEFATNASIVELAERAGVSAPTVTRFCRRLGCSGFTDFKVRLAKSGFVGMRYLKPEPVTTTAQEVMDDITAKAQNALYELHRDLDPALLDRAADMLAGADMILAFGSGGNSSMIAEELHNRLFRLGCRISAASDHGMYLMQAAAAEKGAVVFGSSFSGRNHELVKTFRVLAERGIPTIALTQPETPLAKTAHLLLPVALPEGQNIFRPSSTRYAFLAVIDMVANLVAYRDRDHAAHVLRRIKASLLRHRDEDDKQLLGD